MKFDRGWWFLLLVALPMSVISDTQPGFVITAPKKIRIGQPYTVNGVLLYYYIGATCNIALRTESNKDVVTGQMRFVGKTIGEKNSVTLTVPASTRAGDYQLNAYCSGSGAVMNKTMPVKAVSEFGVIYIQMDKGIYKPGQTVKIRVLGLTAMLKPADTNLDVFALDPNGTRIEQWKNVSTDTGVVKLELELANQLPMGTWKIQAAFVGGLSLTEANFTVEKYVLPRFSVKFVNMPRKFVVYNSDSSGVFSFSLQSMYTYGKPVKGTAKVSITHGDGSTTSKFSETLTNGKASFRVELPVSKFRNDYGFYYCRIKPEVKVVATVIEDQLNEEETAMATVGIEASEYQISFEDIATSFTSNMPYPVHMKVVDFNSPDGGIPNNERAAFSLVIYMNGSDGSRYIKEEFALPQDGTIFVRKLMIPTIKNENSYFYLEMQAVLKKNGKWVSSTDTNYINRFTSESKLSVRLFVWEPAVTDPNAQKQPEGQMKSSLDNVKRNQEVAFRAYYKLKSQCFYLLMSKGETVGSDSAYAKTIGDVSACDFTVRVGLYAPKLTVLVYVVTPSGEILADSLELTVSDAIKQKASIAFDGPQEVDAGTKVNLKVKTGDAVRSYVGIAAVDQSVLLLSHSNDIDEPKVMDGLERLDGSTKKEFSNYKCFCGCWRFRRSVMPGGSGDSSYSVFSDAGVVILSDATISKPDPHGGWGEPVFAMEEARVMRTNMDTSKSSSPDPSSSSESETETRKDFPETWIFDDKFTGDNGVYEGLYEAPDTITSWVAKAFTLSKEYGLDVPPSTAKLTVFRPFFVYPNLPYSVKRGESFSLEIYVFNYLNTDIRGAKVVLAASNDYLSWPIGADEMTVNDISKAVKATRTSFVDVESQGSAGVKVWIIPKELGKIRINITATFDDKIDRLSKELLVEPEGDPVYKSSGKVIEVSSSNTEITVYVDRGVSNIVPGSQAVGISVVGDLLGPSLTNLDSLLRVPCGCGEQNMITFVPNIFVMKYLKSVSRLTPDIMTRSKKNMKIGYQRELNYVHKDGSFSAFGESDKSGSSWLTAFVVRSFIQADEFIMVDSDVLVKGLRFLLGQYRDNQIHEPGRVHHSDMQGGSGQEGLAMTTYVFLTLYEGMAKKILQQKELADLSQKVSQIQGMIEKTFIDSIRTESRSTMTNFELAIVSYALALAGSSYTGQVLGVLETRATNTNEGLKFWRTSTEPYNPYKTINGRQGCWFPPVPSPSEVETSSYVVLAYVVKKDFRKSLPIIKWLMEQMNEKGAFRSTQDTVMGLQSLSKFASMTTTENSNINFEISSDGNELDKTLSVTPDKKFLVQTLELTRPSEANWVTIKASGTGMAKATIFWRYNVYKSDQDDSELIDITTNIKPISNDIYDMIIDVKYKGKDPSMMALVKISDLSGFRANEADIKTKNKDNISRLEVLDKEITLYVDDFKQDQVQRYEIRSTRTDKVADVKPGFVSATLYYKPEITKRAAYELPKEMQLNRCQLDGGISCPLPIINVGGASATTSGLTLILMSLLLAIFSMY